MDKIQKFLKRLNQRERAVAARIIKQVQVGDLSGSDVKKLKGYSRLFRARQGDIRIIFSREEKEIRILFIGRRGEDTYK